MAVVESNTATMKHGTLYVPTTGILIKEKKLESYVEIWVTTYHLNNVSFQYNNSKCSVNTICLSLAFVLMDYGKGNNPILPMDFLCDNAHTTLSGCPLVNSDGGQCKNIAGINCFGWYN